MVDRLNLRIPTKLKERIEQDAKEQGKTSVNEYAVEALEHYLNCKKAYEVASFRFIITRFKGNCIRCGRVVEKTEGAYYARGTGLLCLDCSIFKGMSDKTVVAKYMKMRRFEELARMFKAEVEASAEKLDLSKAAEKLDEIYKCRKELNALVHSYLKEVVGQPKERETLEDIIKLGERELRTLMDLETFLEIKMRRKVKKATGVV